MSKENLFSLVKREEVIIWAGAGMSKYAGFPDSNKLRDLIIAEVSPEGQKQIPPMTPLIDAAEIYKNIKGGSRRDLVALLNRIFKAKPTATHAHDKLCLIPHIRTIVTTNYDNMFEQAYGHKAQSFYKPNQVTQLDKNLIQIFKAHGDLVDPDSLIITSSDYSKFFAKDLQYDSFWTIIKERLVNNSVLFIGYGLEDLNTKMIIGNIIEELRENRREYFLAAPNLPQHKVNDLIRRGIQYIDVTAEDIISEMLLYLQHTILTSAANSSEIGSIHTVTSFLGNFDVGATTQSDGVNNKITSVFPTSPSTMGTLKFTVNDESKSGRELREFMTKPVGTPIECKAEDLENIEFRIGEIRIPFGSNSFIIGAIPNFDEKIMVRFENGFEYSDLHLKAFSGDRHVEVQTKLRGANLNIAFFPVTEAATEITTNLTFKPHKMCRSVREEIELFTLLSHLVSGLSFSMYTSKGTIPSGARRPYKESKEYFNWYLRFFELLKVVETHYGLFFNNFIFEDINENLVRILAKMNDKKSTETWDQVVEIRVPNRELKPEDLGEIAYNQCPQVTIRRNYEETAEILGQKIVLGYSCLEILNPRIANLKKFQKDHSVVPQMVSAKKKCNIYFTDTYQGPDPNNAELIFVANVDESNNPVPK